MQRIIALILLTLLTFSCSNETEFNTTAFQGTINYESWLANKFHASFTDDGNLKIIGVSTSESLTLEINDISEGIHTLGATAVSSAVFEDENFDTYSTLNNGDGEIVIENYDSENLTISGTFKFNSYSISGKLVNFIHGVFYKIPIDAVTNELSGSNSFNASINSVVNENEVDVVETDIIDGELKITTNYLDGTYFEFFIPENIHIGSYTLNASTQIYANYVFANGTIASSQYGTLTILEHDSQFKKIKASFLFNTGNPYNVTISDGNFIVYY